MSAWAPFLRTATVQSAPFECWMLVRETAPSTADVRAPLALHTAHAALPPELWCMSHTHNYPPPRPLVPPQPAAIRARG
eukprot:2807523-Prymnesium_polylepis.1